MKTMHICAAHHRKAFEQYQEITTYRTGWIKELYRGDLVMIYIKGNKEEKKEYEVICIDVASYNSWQRFYGFEEEIKAYQRKFDPRHIFIQYKLKPLEAAKC